MFIREASDLHLEFYRPTKDIMFEFPRLDTDSETVLVLSGDVTTENSLPNQLEFFETCAEQFQDVIYIMGNHEYYGGNLESTFDNIKKQLSYIPNITVINDGILDIGDVSFICSTLWSDFDNNNPIIKTQAMLYMNDYKMIRYSNRQLYPDDILEIFNKSKDFILSNIVKKTKEGKKVVVVTHMSPSFESTAPQYRGNILNGCYCSALECYIERTRPSLWFHGHVHNSADYIIENPFNNGTRIVCNPYGYHGIEVNESFDAKLLIDL